MKKISLLTFVLILSFPIIVFAKDNSINKISARGTGRTIKIELNNEHCGFLPE
jgi:hypothetical protein